MMKCILAPVYFASGDRGEIVEQLEKVKQLLVNEADFLDPVEVTERVSPSADAVVFVQLVGEAFSRVEVIRKIPVPILVLTSEFGTMAMWDWELVSILKDAGVGILAPYDVEQARAVCRALALKKEMRSGTFLVYQDDPGEGFQADIFKRFFWWERDCIDLVRKKFGVTVVKKSLKELGRRAVGLSGSDVENLNVRLACPCQGVSDESMRRAARLMLAVQKDLQGMSNVIGVGTNCLNESQFCDTTPCVAWNALYEEQGILWACEADILSMLSMVVMHKPLATSLLMTNIYPFLMGMAALKHEHIDAFPDIKDPDNHALLAHCGYLGIVPRSHATDWMVRPKVLDIVNEEAIALDTRIPVGPITLYKLSSQLDKLMVVEGELEGYVQYPESHCKNGAVVRVADGHALMKRLYSHHQCVAVGHLRHAMEWVADVFEIELETLS